MGMAASQGRFLQLTSRKMISAYSLLACPMKSVSSREMQNVSRKYQDGLNTKL